LRHPASGPALVLSLSKEREEGKEQAEGEAGVFSAAQSETTASGCKLFASFSKLFPNFLQIFGGFLQAFPNFCLAVLGNFKGLAGKNLESAWTAPLG